MGKEKSVINRAKTYAFSQKALKRGLALLIDYFVAPLVMVGAVILKQLRIRNVKNFPFSKRILLHIGVFPIRDHYYEPLFNPKHLLRSLREDRPLPGIEFNDEEQLAILSRFVFNEELLALPYSYEQDSFLSGDTEYYYSIIRLFKPRRIYEIGSGSSTLMAILAIEKNKSEDHDYSCELVCIEPYEAGWLEEKGVKVIRERVEAIDISYFKKLQRNDILFIDSSHMIRPQGDVLFEYLEVLPSLAQGVIIHIHDIFTPKDYLDSWIVDDNRLWNEQYLLEAFLSCNNKFRIIGATNYLMHKYLKEFSSKCPVFASQTGREPGSFWMVRTDF